MKRAILGDRLIGSQSYESFKLTIDRMGATFTARSLRRQGADDIKVVGGEVRFSVESLIMTRKELEAFDEKGHWEKILEVCRQYEFSPLLAGA